MFQKFLNHLKNAWSLDYRSLACMRIFVGLTILLDLIQRAHYMFAHYTDDGVLPRAELFRLAWDPSFWSLHTISGGLWFQIILFVTAGVFSIMLILGYRTKIAVVISWVLLVSLQNRNPIILQGGDVALRVVLFWMMFMPLATRYSLDSLLGRISRVKSKTFFGVSSIVYISQIMILYIATGFLKNGDPWTTSHSAVFMALSLQTFTTYFGNWLFSLKSILPFLTTVTLFIERYVPFLFVSPIWNGYFRLIAFGLLNLMIYVFNLSFRLGLFGMIMFSISLALLPSLFWDKIVKRIKNIFSEDAKKGVTIFYDAGCGFCFNATRAIKQLLCLHASTQIKPSSENSAAYTVMLDKNSWVVMNSDGELFTEFNAFRELLKSSFIFKFFYWLSFLPGAGYIGRLLYRSVADHRPLTCTTDDVKNNIQTTVYKKYLINPASLIVVFVFGFFMIVWNLRTLNVVKQNSVPQFMEDIILFVRLDQKWDMFAPYPTTEDGWYIMPGVLEDGSEVDVYTGKEVVYQKPKMMSYIYNNQRWQKYMMNLWLKNYAAYRLSYGQYICREWNKENSYEKQLKEFHMIYMLEELDVKTLKDKEIRPVVIWEHACY